MYQYVFILLLVADISAKLPSPPTISLKGRNLTLTRIIPYSIIFSGRFLTI